MVNSMGMKPTSGDHEIIITCENTPAALPSDNTWDRTLRATVSATMESFGVVERFSLALLSLMVAAESSFTSLIISIIRSLKKY